MIEEPFAAFRNPDGTFKMWLHTWCYVTDPPPHIRGRGVMLGRPYSPLPWVFEVPPDGEFLTGLYHTGYTKRLPGQWPQFSPPGPEQAAYINGKIYGAVFAGFNADWVPRYLAELRKQSVTQQDFYGVLGLRHTLYSRNRSLNADTRFDQNRTGPL